MREFNVAADFTVADTDHIAGSVYAHERDDPDHVIFQRLVNGVWTDVTCAAAAQQIRTTALGLIAENVNAGDRVAILSATRYEWVILDYAILSVGAVTVPIYDTSSAEQVRWVLEDSGAVLAIAETDAHAQVIKELSDELPSLRRILQLESSGPTALDELAEAGKAVDVGKLDQRLASLRAADPATLIYTSGTTGRPKGCQLTHSNLLYEARGAASCFPTLLRKGERLLVFLPLAHVLARSLSMSAFANKVTIGYTSDIKNLVSTLAVFQPTVVVSVPRVFEKVYNTAELKAQDSGRARSSMPPLAPRSNGARPWTPAVRACCCGPGMRCSTGWCTASYAPRSAATAMRRFPGSAVGQAAVPLLPRRRGDHLRGLRAHRDQRRDHREPGRRRAGRHRRQAVTRQQHGDRQ
ncbi:hypothetical protein NIIDMKKI_79800 [Mycobacterium kansasii]|uniref:AMP-dependent synthetase/ligase domain-containing protein n=1 Tax=Mycobacterium kansasii TaxID=1768 RepID=A0A7G1IQV7_MYCKA|nr:hypothetical protein NIIDMKKI_79800 [Mycobacterium kansasii]